MRRMSTKFHGALDYTLGPMFALAPLLFGFGRERSAALLPIAYSAASLGYTLFTDYERGLRRRIPMRGHLAADAAWGAALIAAPFLLGSSRRAALALVGIGAFEILAAALTERESTPEVAVPANLVGAGRDALRGAEAA